MVRGARAFVASWVVCLGAAVPTATPAAVVYGRAATFEWSPAQGPVEGYAVYVARNSSAFPPIPETILQGNGRRRATVTASYGDTLQVRVAAFNERDGMGPLSPSSTTVTFLAPAGQAANFGRQGSDFDGDGRSDVLFQDPATGRTVIWKINGTRLVGDSSLGALANARAEAVGDFDGDGRQDLLFRRSSDGLIYAWLVDGVQVVAHGGVSALHRTWAVVATPDLNADGRHDILLQRNDGLVYAWLMQGTRVVDHGGVALQDRRWAVVGASDPQAIGVR